MILFKVEVTGYGSKGISVIPELKNMSWQEYPDLLELYREALQRENKRKKRKGKKNERGREENIDVE